MGLESLFRTARVKASQGLDVEKQEIVEEAPNITDGTDKVPNEYEHVTVASRKFESTPAVHLEKQRDNSNGEKDSNHATASHTYTHMNHGLGRELLKGLEMLLSKLQEDDGQDRCNIDIETDELKYKSIVEQFKMQTLVSTFTAALIIAWCSLVKTLQVDGAHAELLYNVGLLFSLFALAFHIFNIVLSSRCVSLYSDHTILKKKTIIYFCSTFETCEGLYLYGLLLFAVAVLEMSFIVFDNVVYPAVFCSLISFSILTLGHFKDLWNVYRTIVRIEAPERITTAYRSHGVVVARDSWHTK